MEAMRQTWTDDRLDDLVQRVDNGFAQVDARFEQMHADMGSMRQEFQRTIEVRGSQTDAQAIELRKQIESQGSEFRGALDRQGVELRQEMAGLRSEMQVGFRSIQRMVFQLCAGLCFALIAAIGSLIATQI